MYGLFEIDRADPEIVAKALAAYAAAEARQPALSAEHLRDLRYRVGRRMLASDGPTIHIVTEREIVALLRLADPAGSPIDDLARDLLGGGP